MLRIEKYGLVGLCGGNGTITSQQDKERFEKTEKAMEDFVKEFGRRDLGAFYNWLQQDENTPLSPTVINWQR